MNECIVCHKPMVLTKEQALKLNCTGIHFLEDDLTPVQAGAFVVGNGTVIRDVEHGIDVRIGNYSDLYHCRIGNHTKIGPHVVVEGGVIIGQFCKIKAFTFIPEGTRIGNFVFIGPGVVFTNDKNPRATGNWKMAPVTVEDEVTIGAGAVLLPGVRVGKGATIGAGAVVTKDVPERALVVGNPARVVE